jgi:hypothetical protein
MKMFGFLNQNQAANNSGASGASGANRSNQGKQLSSHPVSSQFNLASIMRMQSTGCKSCRG